jgi:WD40 repeat protein
MNEAISASESNFGPQRISEIDIRDSENVIITQKQIIQISVDEIKTREFIENSPYKGLKKFESGDKDLFFGREQLLAELVGDLENHSLILLLGASGSGKSSVVRAGIVPWFTRKYGAKSILTFTPGQNPFESLYACLLTNEYSIDKVKFVQQNKTDTLLQVVKKLKPKNAYWLIFIDQFEQLFSRISEEKGKLFLESLVRLIKRQDQSVKLIMTMRADFLDRFTPYPKFGKLTEKRIRLMTDMDDHELRLAIEQPAAQHGVVFEKGLVEEIIKEVQGRPGYLPLLQYTLDLLWETERKSGGLEDRTLNTSTYRQLGGVIGALSKHVNNIYAQLDKKGRGEAVKYIFLRLVDFAKTEESGVIDKPVSRRASRSEFEGDSLLKNTLDELIAPHRLLVSDHQEGKTIEVAHESLLVNWDTLKGWIKEAHEVITWRNRLAEDVKRWHPTKDKEDLWYGSKLEKVLEIRKENAFASLGGKGLNQEENYFIDLSVAQRDRNRRKSLILAWGITSSSIIGLVIISALGWIAFQNARNANIQAVQALIQTVEASLASNQPFDAWLAAIRAGRQLKDANLTNTELLHPTLVALLEVAGRVRESNRLEGHKVTILTTKFSPDGQTVASVDRYGTVKLWQRDGGLIKSFELNRVARGPFYQEARHYDVLDFSPDSQKIVAVNVGIIEIWNRDGTLVNYIRDGFLELMAVKFSPDGQLIASIGHDGSIVLWHWQKNNTPIVIQGHQHEVNTLKFSPDGQTIATASKDGTAKLWQLDGTLLTTFSKHAVIDAEELKWADPAISVIDVEFSPDGRMIATANKDGTVTLWRKDGTLVTTLKASKDVDSDSLYLADPSDKINNVEFSPDGKMIATAGNDQTVRLWELDGNPLATLRGHEDGVKIVQFSPDGQIIASAADNGVVKLWQNNGTLLATLVGHTDWVRALDFSSDGKTIASASGDGTVKLWKLYDSPLTILKGHSVEFSQDGQTIATATGKGEIELWRLDGTPITTLEGDEVRFSPNGQLIATQIDKDGQVKLWQQNGTPLSTLEGHGAQFSPDSQLIATIEGIDRFQDDPLPQVIKLWQRNGTLITTLKGHTDLIHDVQFSPDSQMIVTASRDDTFKLWQRNGTLIATLKAPSELSFARPSWASTIKFSPNGQRIASLLINGTVQLWQRNGNLIRTFPPVGESRTGGGYPMAQDLVIRFSPDGQIIAAASGHGNVGLWQEDGTVLTLLSLYPQYDGKVQFSPDFDIIATTSDDRIIQLWQRDGKPLATLEGHTDWVSGLQFSPDGRNLASVDRDGTVILWSFDLDNLLERSCSWLHDYLSNNPNVKAEERELCGIEPSAHLIAEEGRNLAKEGDVERAIAKFQKALEINPGLTLDPREEVALALEKLLTTDKVSEAIVAYQKVQKLMPTSISARSWNNLCWVGSLHGHAAEVMAACEKAVSLAPKDSVFNYQDSRGLARALTGDTQGAIEDFQAFIESPYSKEEEKAQRQRWIDALRAGKNPFTKEELESLL